MQDGTGGAAAGKTEPALSANNGQDEQTWDQFPSTMFPPINVVDPVFSSSARHSVQNHVRQQDTTGSFVRPSWMRPEQTIDDAILELLPPGRSFRTLSWNGRLRMIILRRMKDTEMQRLADRNEDE
jgi:hypothetical protein